MATNDPHVVLIQLGILLRRLREEANLTALVSAQHLGCSTAKISKMENGKQTVKADEVSRLLELYGADDSRTAEALRLASVPKPRRRGTYRDSVPEWFRRFLVLESEAVELSIYENEVISGVLQTEDYARTVLQSGYPFASGHELTQQVEVRMRRNELLTKKDAPKVDLVLHEATLHRVIGGDLVMEAQIEHLAKLAELPNVRLRVLPFRPVPTQNHDEAFMAKTAFMILKLEATGAVVYVEDAAGANYPEESDAIQAYANAYQRLVNAALPPEASIQLLGRVKDQYC